MAKKSKKTVESGMHKMPGGIMMSGKEMAKRMKKRMLRKRIEKVAKKMAEY